MAGYNLENFRAIADRRIRRTIYSSLFKRCPLAAFMVGLGGAKSNLDRPGAMGILSGQKLPAVKREQVDGGVYTDIEVLTAKSGGGRTRSARDTNPAVEQSQDQNIGSARFWWWFHTQPIKVWRHTLKLAGRGKYRIQNILEKSVDMARDEQIDTIASKIWTGTPSSWNVSSSSDCYDDLPGVVAAMSESNSYGNVDRSDSDYNVGGRHPWASNRESDDRVASLELIDEANDVAMVYGDGVDLALTTRAVYRKLKKEALAKGGTIIHNGNVPGYGMVGYQREAILYGSCVITFDPFCPTGYLGAFTLRDWCIEIHSEENFAVDDFQRLKGAGQDDAFESAINVGLRPYCMRPVNQYLFTSVS